MIANNYDFIGMIDLDEGNHLSAKSYFVKALALKKEQGDISAISFSHTNLGVAYTFLERYDSAMFHLDRALDIR